MLSLTRDELTTLTQRASWSITSRPSSFWHEYASSMTKIAGVGLNLGNITGSGLKTTLTKSEFKRRVPATLKMVLYFHFERNFSLSSSLGRMLEQAVAGCSESVYLIPEILFRNTNRAMSV